MTVKSGINPESEFALIHIKIGLGNLFTLIKGQHENDWYNRNNSNKAVKNGLF